MRICALAVAGVVALVGLPAAAQVEPPPPVASRDLRRTLERIDRESVAIVLHPSDSRDRAEAVARWAADVADEVREHPIEVRGEAALLQMAALGMAAAARREDASDVRAWAQVVRDRVRNLAWRLSTEAP